VPLTSGSAVNARALQERLGGSWRRTPESTDPADDETWLASMPLLRDWTASSTSAAEGEEDGAGRGSSARREWDTTQGPSPSDASDPG